MAYPALITKLFGADFLAGRLKTAPPVADGDAVNKAYVDYYAVRTFPKAFVGLMIDWESTVLPPDCCWPNGDFIGFGDWPEIAEKYVNGGFAGMLLAYDASADTIAANLSKWRPNAASPTGLYTPNRGDQFARAWVEGLTTGAGASANALVYSHSHWGLPAYSNPQTVSAVPFTVPSDGVISVSCVGGGGSYWYVNGYLIASNYHTFAHGTRNFLLVRKGDQVATNMESPQGEFFPLIKDAELPTSTAATGTANVAGQPTIVYLGLPA
jgi:hypothetical protein